MDGFAPGRPFYLTPGQRRLRLGALGREDAEATATLGAGATRTIRMTLRPVWGGVAGGSRRDPLPGAAASESPSAAPWVIGGLGVAAGIGGTVLLALSENNLSTIERECPNLQCPPGRFPIYQEIESTRVAQFHWGLGLLISGGASVAVAAIWLLVRRPSSTSTPTARWYPAHGGIAVSF